MGIESKLRNPSRRELLAALGMAALGSACGGGGGNPAGPSNSGVPVTQVYSVQDNTGRELTELSYIGEQGKTVTISGADFVSKLGSKYDSQFFVTREMHSGGMLGKFGARTSGGTLNNAVTGVKKVLYVVDTSSGFVPHGVLDIGFGNSLPYGRTPTVSMMPAGVTFPKYDVNPVTMGGFEYILDATIDIVNKYGTNDSGTVLFRANKVAQNGNIQAAVVPDLGGPSGWHTNTGQIAVISFGANSGKTSVLVSELFEESQRADNLYNQSSGATLFPQLSESLDFSAKGKAAYQYSYIFAQ